MSKILGILFLGYQVKPVLGSEPGVIHEAPLVFKGSELTPLTHHLISRIKLYRTDQNGRATAIPFQIDEVNHLGDYILDKGPNPNDKQRNGIFDRQDELSFMGKDVGELKAPQVFVGESPAVLYQLEFSHPLLQKKGAVYVGIHKKPVPQEIFAPYVVFEPEKGLIRSKRYEYQFDPKNYLVSQGVWAIDQKTEQKTRIVDHSVFYLQADLKYFLTFVANQDSIDSRLEAYKVGPVRTIIRFDFVYKILKMNIDVGMYTELSFFANRLLLPAVMHSPIDGRERLNRDSYFYYGFTFVNPIESYAFSSNIPNWPQGTLSKWLPASMQPAMFHLALQGRDHTIYLEIEPSQSLHDQGVVPFKFSRTEGDSKWRSFQRHELRSLQNPPVNLAVGFDLSQFPAGENGLSLSLFFDNKGGDQPLKNFKEQKQWTTQLTQLP